MAYNEGVRTFTASGAVTAHSRVKIASGTTTTPPQVALAGLGEQHVGTCEYAAADGDIVSVKLRNYNGTVEAIAASSISIGATIYGATGGKVASTSSGTSIGFAIEAATADGDIIEILQY
ncbi:MAG: capsid cement protein [Dehalococcoidia bacterium]|jgi:hypothetical protein